MQCFLNGEFLPLPQARISPFDRGFLFGDGVYEVVPIYRRRLFHWRRHLARLAASLEKIRLPFDVETLSAAAKQLIQSDEPQLLYIQITRGEYPTRRFPPPEKIQPTVFMAVFDFARQPADKIRAGVHCRSAVDTRWMHCDIKSTSLLGAVLLAPPPHSGEEDVMLFRDGILAEGSSGNYLLVKDGTVRTPLADNRMLCGVTYRAVCDVAATLGFSVQAGDWTAADVAAADEIWLTSSARELLPVTRLDDQPVGSGVPGVVFQQVYAAWQAYLAGSDWHDDE